MRRRLILLAPLAMALACNAITGTGKYDVVDCPSGSCGDGGNAAADGQTATDAASGDGSPGVDSGAPAIDCGPGLAPVTLTVTGSAGTVSAKTGGSLSVSVGDTQTACLTSGTVELRTNGPSATWTGPACKDGSSGDRCEFGVPAKGISVTAALP